MSLKRDLARKGQFLERELPFLSQHNMKKEDTKKGHSRDTLKPLCQMHSEASSPETEQKRIGECLKKMSECFLDFKATAEENINRLVCICGEFMGATCALYNRLEKGMLCSAGQWQTPPDFKSLDKPQGHICYDVIMHPDETPFIVRNLQNSPYAKTDPNVMQYKLQTYVGIPVKFNNIHIGALCVVFQEDFVPRTQDIRFMEIIVSAITVEENRRQTQLALEESNKRYQHICETVTDYIYTVYLKDGQPLETIHGPTCVNVTGYTPEEISSDPALWIKMVPEEDRAAVLKHAALILSGEKVAPLEHRIITKDGTIRWVRNTTVLHFNEEGKLLSYDGLIQDITERKEIEVESRKHREQLQTIFDSAPTMVFYKDRNNKMVRVNKSFAEIMGLDKNKIEGKSCFELWPEQAEHYWCDDKEVMASGLPKIGIIEPLVTATKGKIWVETDKIPYTNENGEIVGVIGFAIDISERKKAQDALIQSEEEYRTLVNNVNIGVYRNGLEPDDRFLKVNPAMAKMFGYESAQELMKMRVSQLYRDPQDRLKFVEKIRATGFVKNEELKLLRKDGKFMWAAVTAKINFDSNGKPKWIDGVIEDITERKKAEEELSALNKELIRSNKRLRQLSLRDPQTNLYNHRYLEEVIEAEFHRAKRYVHPFSVIMLDIDYFSSINDVYGHHFGDLVLKQLARQLKKMVSQYDIVIRFGGEEFMIISPGIDRTQALMLARRILDAINLYNFGDKKQTVKVKLSIAVASYPEDKIIKGIDLVALADQILNRVKEYGGNNVYSSLDIHKKESLPVKKIKVNGEVRFLKDKIEKLTKKTNQSLIEAVFAFAKTIELKDHFTGEHVEKTVQYATEIARALDLPPDEIDRIKQAAILHDLGKIGIGEKILVKKLKLTKQEFEEIKKHPQIGVDIIRPIKFLHNIIPLILYHHERWDGKGYPHGLKGEEIPVGARVVALADVYQALTSNRPYRKAYSEKEALKIIKNGSGTQFDPRVVTKFLQVIQKKK